MALHLDTSAGPFFLLTRETLTNQAVSDVHKQLTGKKKTKPGISWQQITAHTAEIYEGDFSPDSVRQSFKLVRDKHVKEQKNTKPAGKQKLTEYLTSLYIPPCRKGKTKLTLTEEDLPCDKRARVDHDSLQNFTIETVVKENTELQEQLSTLKAEVQRLKLELKQCNDSKKSCQKKLRDLYEIIGKAGEVKKVNQKIKRNKEQAVKWRRKSSQLQQSTMKKKCVNCTSNAKKVRALKKNASARKQRTKSQKAKRKLVYPKLLTSTLENTTALLRESNEIRYAMENDLMEAREIIEEKEELIQQEKLTIPTRIGSTNKIHPNVKQTSMLLQGIGIAEGKIGPTIETVVAGMTNSMLDGKLPSKSSQNKLSSEMEAISNKFLEDKLSGKKNLTVKYDGTTKQGRHLVEVEIADEEQSYPIGIQETVGGKAKDYVGCITGMMEDVNVNIQNISNTMTDRCITNDAVDRELQEIKGSSVNSFRCAMHPLDTIHRQCNKKVEEHEHTQLEFPEGGKYPFKKSGESRAQALIRAVDKTLHSDKSGLPKELPRYLREQGFGGGENTRLFPRWVGNRFNIYFVCGGLVYLYHSHILDFFKTILKPRNDLHISVFNALQDSTSLPVLRALGLIDKFVTGPWMRWQGTTIPILETCSTFQKALQTIITTKGADLLSGFDNTAFDTPVKQDANYRHLTTSTEEDDKTAAVVDILLDEVADVMQRQLADYLEGGKYSAPSKELKQAASTCTSNNISGERIFGTYDAKSKQSSTAKPSKVAHKVKFAILCRKGLTEYMQQQSNEDKTEMMAEAARKGKEIRHADQERESNIRKDIVEKMEESKKQIIARDQQKRDMKEKILETIVSSGVWETEEEIRSGVSKLSKTKAIAALKAQIRFRLDMLQCAPPRKVQYTKFSQDEFVQYLIELIQVECDEEKSVLVQVINDPECLVGLKFSQKWFIDGKDQMCGGEISIIKDEEYGCVFDGEEEIIFQTVPEMLADIAVGDIILYYS